MFWKYKKCIFLKQFFFSKNWITEEYILVHREEWRNLNSKILFYEEPSALCKPFGLRDLRRKVNQGIFIHHTGSWCVQRIIMLLSIRSTRIHMHLIPILIAKANKYDGLYHWIRTHLSIILFCHINVNFLRDPQNFGPLWVLKWLLRIGFLAGHTTPPTNFPSLSRRHHHVKSSSLTITTLSTCLYSSQPHANSIRCVQHIYLL